MNTYLLEQLKKHPSMQPQDIVKLCYQAAYGAEHLLTDVAKARQYFFDEFENTDSANILVYENISDQYCRVNIAGWKHHGFSKKLLFDIFSKSLQTYDDSQDFNALMDEYLNTAKEVFSSEEFSELVDYLAEYYKQGIRPIHHSEEYRKAENPHYRVVRRDLLPTKVIPIDSLA